MRIVVICCLLICLSSCQGPDTREDALYRQSVTTWEAGNRTEAIRLMKQVVAQKPTSYPGYEKLGFYYSQEGDAAKAIATLEKAVAFDDHEVEGVLLLGEAYLQLKEYQQAQYNFNQVLKSPELSGDQTFRAYLGKGICKYEQSLHEDAMEALQNALAMRRDDPQALFYNALLREVQIGANTQSMKDYRLVLAKQPEHLGALKQLGDNWKNLEHHEKAVEYYQKFFAVGGESAEIRPYVEAKKQLLAKEQKSEKEVVMACPYCHRIGKKGQDTCYFDGSALVAQEE